ncbi:clock-controlled pheromone ccg-4 precursor [Colletotrichum kahawae]|uniref:Clock-controlled pheromone ccg-4 n=1 Tax=Colletotrichum kahawae TaxID=34407 RepID=A0AAD9YKH7_COLKA|nr:clock-controlled pheromone ccg-4 precursor [Colletotrichum kahawae]
MRLPNILPLILTVAEAAAWCTKPCQRCWKRAVETMETRQPIPAPPVNQGSLSQVQGSQHQRRWNTWPRQSGFLSEELPDVSEVSTSPNEMHEPLTNMNRRSNECEKCSWIKSRSFPSGSLDESDEKQQLKQLKPQPAADAVTRAAIDMRNIQTSGIHDKPDATPAAVERRGDLKIRTRIRSRCVSASMGRWYDEIHSYHIPAFFLPWAPLMPSTLAISVSDGGGV